MDSVNCSACGKVILDGEDATRIDGYTWCAACSMDTSPTRSAARKASQRRYVQSEKGKVANRRAVRKHYNNLKRSE